MHRLLPVLWLALVPATLAAQTNAPESSPAAQFVGRPVVDVRLLSEGGPIDDPALPNLVETPVGQPLSMVAVRQTMSRLFSIGRFEDVQVEATEAPGGVQLRYNLIPIHAVTRVEYTGTLGVSEGVLKARVTDRFGALPPVGRAGEVARILDQQIYRDYGYLSARVRPRTTVLHHPDRTVLTFEIEAGPQSRVGKVDIVGDPLEAREAFQRRIQAVSGGPYEPITIREKLDGFVREMRKKRHYKAAANMAPLQSADGSVVDLSIDVQAGPVVTFAFEGDPLQSMKVADLVPIDREDSVDEDLIEDSERRITDHFNQQGYWKARVTQEARTGDGTLTIVFTVRKGLAYRVDDAGVEVSGNQAVPAEQLRPHFVKLQPGDTFVDANLQAAVDAVKGTYLRLGYAGVKVTTSANEMNPAPDGHGLVRPSIVIVEGQRTLVGAISFEGNEGLTSDQLRPAVQSTVDEPYYGPRVAADRDAVLLAYLNQGFQQADVTLRPVLSEDRTRVDLRFHISEGQRIVVGHIIIVGNTRTDRKVIARELTIRSGQPLGLEDQLESQRRLSALGLFRRARITTLSRGTSGTRDVLVTIEETAPNTLSYGGGLERSKQLRTDETGNASEHVEYAPRGFLDVGRRNLGGKNRSVNLYARVSLRPEDNPDDPAQDGTGYGFSDYRVVGTYREPRVFGARANLTLAAVIEQGVRTSFNFARKGVNAEGTRRLSPGLRVTGRYSFSTTRTFDERLTEEEQANIDRLFPEVRLSSFAGAISRDTRDDQLDPSFGTFMSAEGTLAARALGGEVGFVKSYGQVLWFRKLPGKRRTVFATRAAIGLANGFPREFEGETVDDLPASERFYAGGETTIRGFVLDGVGTPETISPTGFPKGGNAVLIMNGELRVPVWHDVGAAFFIDGGNVFARATEFDLGELRGAVGFGLRYKSPIGPIRLDVGFKMDRRMFGTTLESRSEVHFSIGQAF